MAKYQIIHTTPEQKRWQRRHIVRARNDLMVVAGVAVLVLAVLAVKGF